jgi:hypothetical protein
MGREQKRICLVEERVNTRRYVDYGDSLSRVNHQFQLNVISDSDYSLKRSVQERLHGWTLSFQSRL